MLALCGCFAAMSAPNGAKNLKGAGRSRMTFVWNGNWESSQHREQSQICGRTKKTTGMSAHIAAF